MTARKQRGGIMSQENGQINCMQKCERIIEWADDKYPELNFDTGFVEDLLEKFQSGRTPTEKQEQAIDNIYRKFHVESHFKNKHEAATSGTSSVEERAVVQGDFDCPVCLSKLNVIDNEYPYWCKDCRTKFKRPEFPTEAVLFGPK